jgi:hypothetical protein
MLDRDLEEAEDQYQMALRTHLGNIDSIIQIHDNRLYAMERAFQKELKTIQDEFVAEKQFIVNEKFTIEKKELRAIIDAIENEENERENEAKHMFEQMREEIRNKNLEAVYFRFA